MSKNNPNKAPSKNTTTYEITVLLTDEDGNEIARNRAKAELDTRKHKPYLGALRDVARHAIHSVAVGGKTYRKMRRANEVIEKVTDHAEHISIGDYKVFSNVWDEAMRALGIEGRDLWWCMVYTLDDKRNDVLVGVELCVESTAHGSYGTLIPFDKYLSNRDML